MQLSVNKVLQSIQIMYIYPNVIFPILQNMEGTQINEDLIFRPRLLDCNHLKICIISNEAGRKKIFFYLFGGVFVMIVVT